MNYRPGVFKETSKNKPYKIFCRNFLFLVLFIDLVNAQSSVLKKNNFKILIFKKRNHVGSFLRAPYKNKTAQYSLGILRYYIYISIKLTVLEKIYLLNKREFFFKIKNFLYSYNYFESALATQVYRVVKLPIFITLF